MFSPYPAEGVLFGQHVNCDGADCRIGMVHEVPVARDEPLGDREGDLVIHRRKDRIIKRQSVFIYL